MVDLKRKKELSHDEITTALAKALEPLDRVHALWEAGSASFGRTDRWSDIDLYVVVRDDGVEESMKAIEKALLELSEVEANIRLPEPTWHGHSQVFYRLKDASPFLFLDIVVMKESGNDKFLQYDIHGIPLVHFDKKGIVKNEPIDGVKFLERLESRLETLKSNFKMFQVLTLKELNRGNDMEALSYYMGTTFRPLVEVLRIKYCPHHYNFHTSYIYYDLPPDVVRRLHRLAFVKSCEGIRKSRAEAEEWFWKTIRSIDRIKLRKKLRPLSVKYDN